MLVSLLILVVCLTAFFIVRERIDRLPSVVRVSVLGLLVLVMAVVLTMEFFIYVHERLQLFLAAIEPVPGILVIAVFAGLIAGAVWLLRALAPFSRENFQQFLQDTFVPRARETLKDVAKTSRLGWQGLKLGFLRRRPKEPAPPPAPQEQEAAPAAPRKRTRKPS